MGGFQRLTLVLDVLLGLVLALAAVGVAIHPHWAQAPPWGTSLTLAGRWGIGLVGGVWILLSVALLRSAFGDGGRLPRVHHTALGDVRVSVSAVENMATRVAAAVDGVREARVRVNTAPSGSVRVQVRAWVTPEPRIPQLAEEVQQAVKAYLLSAVGLEVDEVLMTVTDIGAEARKGRGGTG